MLKILWVAHRSQLIIIRIIIMTLIMIVDTSYYYIIKDYEIFKSRLF